MSPEDMEMLRSAYVAFDRHEIDTWLHHIDPDAEMETAAELPDHDVYRGPEGFKEALAKSTEPFDELRVKLEDLIDAGDHAVALIHIQARGRESQAPVEIRVAHVWQVRRGKAVRLRVFLDRTKARAAVGLGEAS